MADVIRIKDRMERKGRKSGSGNGMDATILLFTGIRYERMEKLSAAAKPAGPKPTTPVNGASNTH